jgi:hypothetical protein
MDSHFKPVENIDLEILLILIDADGFTTEGVIYDECN